MPELPDITVYVERLTHFVVDKELTAIRIRSPFVLRTVEPGIDALAGQRIKSVQHIGKRIVLCFGTDRDAARDLYCVIHLMISGRLRWKKPGVTVPKSNGLAAFDFEDGSLLFTEASKKKRASIHIVEGEDALMAFDRGGIDVLSASGDDFHEAMMRENHTLKRALTDQRILSGIGNAYSDEILHRARMSPFRQTSKMSRAEFATLHDAIKEVLNEWTTTLRDAVGEGFPDKVTAFHSNMAVHGRYNEPCPVCQAPVQRIRYAENEANYCARCQTDGKVLADRSLSRLLKSNWPKNIEELM